MSKDDLQSTGSEGTLSLGQKLQRKRIESGLSLEDVAQELHLSVGVIQAIEEDDNNRFPAVFFEGYLKAYANLLGLVLEQADLKKQPDEIDNLPRPIYGERPSLASSSSRKSSWVRLVLILIIILGASLSAWWLTNPEFSLVKNKWSLMLKKTSSNQKTRTPSDVTIPKSGRESSKLTHKRDVNQTPFKKHSEIVKAETSNKSQSPARVTTKSAKPSFHMNSLDNALKSTTWMPSTFENLFSISNATQQDAFATASTLPPSTKRISQTMVVHLKLQHPCWVSVLDGKGKVVLEGLLTGGQRVFTGTPPLHIILGYISGVVLTVNGHRINFKSWIHHSNHTARFSVLQTGKLVSY